MDTHAFNPSRPGGTICMFDRSGFQGVEAAEWQPCGYPAGHPVHAADAAPAPTGNGAVDEALARIHDARQALAELRTLTSATAAPDGEAYAARNRAMALLDRIERAL